MLHQQAAVGLERLADRVDGLVERGGGRIEIGSVREGLVDDAEHVLGVGPVDHFDGGGVVAHLEAAVTSSCSVALTCSWASKITM